MKRLILIFTVVLLMCVCWAFYCLSPHFTPAKSKTGLVVKRNFDDTIRIAYIGDSWAECHKKFHCNIASVIQDATGREVQVRTEGTSGMTSKNVYYGIYFNDRMRSVIEWGPDFCFVVAGINDSDRKMGSGFYRQNMKLIIESLLDNHIVPIILEIPKYDVYFSFKRRSRLTKLQYLASMFLTLSKMDCILQYRDAYSEMIKEQGYQDKVLTIYSMEWNPDGYLDTRGLYDAGLMHLNEKGYMVLDSCISNKVIDYLSHKKKE